MGCHFLLQGIFLTQGSNTCLLLGRWIVYHLSHQGRFLLISTPVILQPIPKILFNLNYLHENPIPQYSHLLRTGGLKLQQINFRGVYLRNVWLPWWLSGKESACNAGDSSSIPGLGRSPGGGKGNPLQYSCLENPMDSLAGCYP